MLLPIVMIFERHWDEIPKLLVGDLLPSLANHGYDTLCFEAPQNLGSKEIIDRSKNSLEFDSKLYQDAESYLRRVGIVRKLSDVSFTELVELMRLYVSSKKYMEVAEKIKQLPASLAYQEVFNKAEKLKMVVKGIDIDSDDYDGIIAVDISKRMTGITKNEDDRVATMFKNLIRLRNRDKGGVIFICGALHATGLLDRFKEKNLADAVFYYFPHSSSRYDDSFDDFSVLPMSTTFRDHAYLLTKQEIGSLSEKIITEVTGKIGYKKEIPGGNSHTQFLSNFFKVNFRAFLRSGFYVDALMEMDVPRNIDNIKESISKVGIQTHNTSIDQRQYLVIPDINTGEVGDKIRKMASTHNN